MLDSSSERYATPEINQVQCLGCSLFFHPLFDDGYSLLIENKVRCLLKKVHLLSSTYKMIFTFVSLYILSKIADVGLSKTPTPLASANIGNWDPPSPPKTCRRLKWMVPSALCNVYPVPLDRNRR